MNDNQLSIVRPLHSHPVPLDQDEIDQLWEQNPRWVSGDPPSVDAAHEDHIHEIAEYHDWRVFRCSWPFGHSNRVYLWNRNFGEGFAIDEDEGDWHSFVNLMAAVVDEEGDCRDGEFSSSLRQSGSYDQQCKECGQSWTVG